MNSVTLVGRVMTDATGYARTGGGEAMFMLETSGLDEGAGCHAIVLGAGLEARCMDIMHAGGTVWVEGVLCACPPGYVRARTVLMMSPGGGGAGQAGPTVGDAADVQPVKTGGGAAAWLQ